MTNDPDHRLFPDETVEPARAARVPWVRRMDAGPVFTKTVTPTLEDHLAVDYADGRPVSTPTVVGSVTLVTLGVVAALSYDAWAREEYGTVAVRLAGALVVGLALGWGLTLLLRWGLLKLLRSGLRAEGRIDDPYVFRADRNGIELVGGGLDTAIVWSTFIDIERDESRYYFWITILRAVVLPKSVFSDDAERESFERWLTKWYGRPPRTPPRMARERTPPPEAASTIVEDRT